MTYRMQTMNSPFFLHVPNLLRVGTAVIFFFVLLSVATAQEMHVMPNNPDASFVTPTKKAAKKLEKKSQKVQEEPPVVMDGVLVNAVRSGKLFGLINPLAPTSDGNGDDTISQDPNELGKPKGVILFGIEW